MSGPEFFQTGMGRTFYAGHVPRIAKALERIAVALEKLAEQQSTVVEPLMADRCSVCRTPLNEDGSCPEERVGGGHELEDDEYHPRVPRHK